MKARLGALAMALAVGATGLTLPIVASAEEPAARTQTATPLALRPDRPLELAPKRERVGAGWKVVALLTVLGGAALYVRKRNRTGAVTARRIDVLCRTTVGLRSELLVVDVDGQRLLLGVTPQSIQTLATLDVDDEVRTSAQESVHVRRAQAEDDMDSPRPDSRRDHPTDRVEPRRAGQRVGATADTKSAAASTTLEERFATLLESAERGAPRPAPGVFEEEETQARGLLALRRRG